MVMDLFVVTIFFYAQENFIDSDIAFLKFSVPLAFRCSYQFSVDCFLYEANERTLHTCVSYDVINLVVRA